MLEVAPAPCTLAIVVVSTVTNTATYELTLLFQHIYLLGAMPNLILAVRFSLVFLLLVQLLLHMEDGMHSTTHPNSNASLHTRI